MENHNIEVVSQDSSGQLMTSIFIIWLYAMLLALLKYCGFM